MISENTQGAEHLGKNSVPCASRDAVEAYSLEQPSVKTDPASKLPSEQPTKLEFENIPFLLSPLLSSPLLSSPLLSVVLILLLILYLQD
jgi:hypothetical protein